MLAAASVWHMGQQFLLNATGFIFNMVQAPGKYLWLNHINQHYLFLTSRNRCTDFDTTEKKIFVMPLLGLQAF